MHIAGIVISVWIGVYTVNWGRILWKDGNKVGACWALGLALASMGSSLLFFYKHGFFP